MSGPYSLITGDMTWSYSRINCFEQCPYQFFLKYINLSKKLPLFFSNYGSFLHDILSRFYSGELSKDQLVTYYLANFRSSVKGKAPNQKIYLNYFQQGMEYLKNISVPAGKIVAVEKSFSFDVDGLPFTGVADLLVKDGSIVIWDHKARALKERSKRGRYTKSDEELDNYLRQLYLYSIAVKDVYGEYPSHLAFNCYRTGQIVMEPFLMDGLISSKVWAAGVVSRIHEEIKYPPSVDFFRCRYLCDVHNDCEFYESGTMYDRADRGDE